MDSNYQPSHSSSFSNPSMSPSKAYSVTTSPISSNQNQTSLPTDSSATPWYVDSAATNHITNDLGNFHLYHPYQGHDQMTVGNGQNVPIQHVGKGLLPTPQYSF